MNQSGGRIAGDRLQSVEAVLAGRFPPQVLHDVLLESIMEDLLLNLPVKTVLYRGVIWC